MRHSEVVMGAHWYDLRRIDGRVAAVIVVHDVIDVNRVGDTGHLSP